MSSTNTGNSPLPPPLAKRAYVGVYTYTNPQGQVIPTRIRWEDGKEWEIDRVLDIRPGTARKAGGAGLRYLLRIAGQEREIFLVDGRWFAEVSPDAQSF